MSLQKLMKMANEMQAKAKAFDAIYEYIERVVSLEHSKNVCGDHMPKAFYENYIKRVEKSRMNVGLAFRLAVKMIQDKDIYYQIENPCICNYCKHSYTKCENNESVPLGNECKDYEPSEDQMEKYMDEVKATERKWLDLFKDELALKAIEYLTATEIENIGNDR